MPTCYVRWQPQIILNNIWCLCKTLQWKGLFVKLVIPIYNSSGAHQHLKKQLERRRRKMWIVNWLPEKNMTPSILGLATEAHFFHVIVNISHHYHRDPPPLLFSSQLWWWLWRWWLWWWWLYSATIMHETGLDEMTRGIWSRNTLWCCMTRAMITM